MCKISIIVPCYNAMDTIGRALESLERQMFKDFETIIIDDGSTDDSVKVIKEYQHKSSLIINLICQENQGVSVARNKGLEKARGKYIAFLDADDEYMPNFLEVLYSLIQDKDIAFCKYKFVPEKKYSRKNTSTHRQTVLSRNEIMNIYYHKQMEFVNFCNGLYRKDVIKRFGIKFPNGIKYGEDSKFFCTYVYYCANGGIYVMDAMYKYILRNNSTTHNKIYENTQGIEVYKSIARLWENAPGFSKKMGSLLIARAIWSAAKDFAIENKECFLRLQKEYKVKEAMKILAKDGDELLIRVSARLYNLSPIVFRKALQIYSKI